MMQGIKKAEETVRLLLRYASTNRLCTAFFDDRSEIYSSRTVRHFLSTHDCLAPYTQKHPRTYLEAEEVYRKIVTSLSFEAFLPSRYETVYCEFEKNEESAFTNLSLTLPIFADENNYIVYSPQNDTYQYGFYHYGKLREGHPMEISPSGRLLICLETQKKKRPRLILAGDAFAPFLVSYIAHHYDICLHAPIESAALLSRDLSFFHPDLLMLIGGISLLENPLLFRALC